MLVMVACCVLAALAGRMQQVFRQASLLRRDLALERDKNRAAQDEVARLRRELEVLHGRLGKLTIHVPNSIYLVALPARDEYEWKWRVYLPKRDLWRVVARHGIVSDKGLVPDPDMPAPYGARQFDATGAFAGGEHEVRAFISLDLVQQRSVVVQVGDDTVRTPLSPILERLILKNEHGWSLMQTGSARHLDENNPLINRAPFPVTFPTGKVELLWWNVRADSSGRGNRAIQIWIEPDDGSPPDFESGPPLGANRGS
ncbi:MAG: hypothetical protein L0211_13955 [Planctomycetaceae bacterium]|nr:hypothetical protein [Planctomycetaceae bacterium]